MNRSTIVVALSLLFVAPVFAGDLDVHDLIELMEGSFSSEAQAAADEAFFHIVLHQARVWSDRADGVWLYAEQVWGAREAGYRFDRVDPPAEE